MRAKKLPSGSWRVQVQIDGKRRSITRKTKKEAESAAAECVLHALQAPLCPLGVLIDKYITERVNVVSASTTERYRRIRKSYLPRVMSLPVCDLTNDRLQAEINTMSKDYAPKTVRAAYGLISATINAYVPDMRLTVKLPPLKRLNYNVPTEADVFNMLDHSTGVLHRSILLAAFCGLRRGEIIALRAEDIQNGRIHVQRAAVYDDSGQLVFKQPKTYHSDRFIIAPDIVLDDLQGLTGRVCPVVPSAITSEFIRLRNSLGLKCRFHDLRHFFASFLHAIEVPDQYIINAGGWRSDFMLKSVYRNTLENEEILNAEKVNARINAHAAHTNTEKSP